MIGPIQLLKGTSIRGSARRGGRAVLFGILAFGAGPVIRGEGAPGPVAAAPAGIPALAFGDFFEAGPVEIKPSPRLLALSGHRVKLVGFMAKMEVAPRGAFYLTPRPVSCDEEGGGTADLPPEAVYVVVRSSPDREVPHTPRALEVTGLLEVGYHVERDERVTHIRLLLDQPQDLLGMSPERNRPPHPTEVNP